MRDASCVQSMGPVSGSCECLQLEVQEEGARVGGRKDNQHREDEDNHTKGDPYPWELVDSGG
jgi:hypothetical protein